MAMKLVKKIRLCEVGPRDGLQNEKNIVSTEDKIALIDELSRAGFPVIEVGSFVSPRAVPQMADTDEVFKGIEKKEGVEYRALIANVKGVERAIACGCTKVKLNVSASVAHNLANLNRTPAQSVAGFQAAVDRAKEAGIGISGSISMAFGSPWDREIPLKDVKDIVDAYLSVGIREISLSDASGMAYPTQVYSICTRCAGSTRRWIGGCISTIRAAWGLPIFWPECRPVFPSLIPASRAWEAAPSSQARRATWPRRMWCTCARRPAWRPAST